MRQIAAEDEIALDIERLGAQGDGIGSYAGKPVFVAGTLPGERIRARLGAERGDSYHGSLAAVLSASPQRIPPPCRHFGSCGGCALQHLHADAYRSWKRETALAALRQRGLALPGEIVYRETAAASRRRAVFAIERRNARIRLGFHESMGPAIVDLAECHILLPALARHLSAMRALAGRLIPDSAKAALHATLTETGLDLAVIATFDPGPSASSFAAEAAAGLGLARLSWIIGKRSPLLLYQSAVPCLRFGGIAVEPPPGGFLQPSLEGEQVLVDEVLRGCKARRIADLFSGSGTFSLPLARMAKVAAFDSDRAAIAALGQAAARAGLGGRLTALGRDLMRAPLTIDELEAFDMVLFDPPRAGAAAQAALLAGGCAKRVIGISCNPATFARDARLLVDGGYRLERLLILDQFVWSPHVELVGTFERRP